MTVCIKGAMTKVAPTIVVALLPDALENIVQRDIAGIKLVIVVVIQEIVVSVPFQPSVPLERTVVMAGMEEEPRRVDHVLRGPTHQAPGTPNARTVSRANTLEFKV